MYGGRVTSHVQTATVRRRDCW